MKIKKNTEKVKKKKCIYMLIETIIKKRKKNSKNCFKILCSVLSHCLLSKEFSILEVSKKTAGYDIWQIFVKFDTSQNFG